MSFRITIRLSKDLYEKIKKLSDDMSDNLSDTCRTAIEHYVQSQENKEYIIKNKKIDNELNYNYINHLKDENTYLKNENIILHEQIDKKILDLNYQLENFLTKPKEKKTPEKIKKNKKEKRKNEKDLFISRM